MTTSNKVYNDCDDDYDDDDEWKAQKFRFTLQSKTFT